MLFVIEELTQIQIAIGIYFNGFPSLLVSCELPLVDLPRFIQLYSPAMSLLVVNLSEVNFPFAFD